MKSLKTIKINYTNNKYWLVPGFFEIIFFASRKNNLVFSSLDQLLKYKNIAEKNLILAFNGDHFFENFNKLQRIKKINFFINEKKFHDVFYLAKTIEFEIVKNLVIVWNKKTLIQVWKGYVPFFSLDFYKNLNQGAKRDFANQIVFFRWTKKWGFVQFFKPLCFV